MKKIIILKWAHNLFFFGGCVTIHTSHLSQHGLIEYCLKIIEKAILSSKVVEEEDIISIDYSESCNRQKLAQNHQKFERKTESKRDFGRKVAKKKWFQAINRWRMIERRKSLERYKHFIHKILKQIHPDTAYQFKRYEQLHDRCYPLNRC